MRKLTVLLAAGLILGASGQAMAATATGTMTVTATLTSSCTVSDAAMTFPDTDALVSTSDQTADTGTTLTVACTTGTTAPTIWSATPRVLANGADSFAFNLSQTSGAAANNLAIASVGDAIAGYVANGDQISVPLYGRILAANFGNKPAKTYTAAIIVSLNY